MTSNLKINILTELKDGPWGGGNQFLKALKNNLLKKNIYEEKPAEADVIIFNSYQDLIPALKLKLKYPNKKFIHRLGPIFFYHRGKKWKFFDKLILKVSSKISDFVIFQSDWSLKESKYLGFKNTPFSIIPNAPDEKIFFPAQNKKPKERIRLISSSWSSNPNKGSDFFSFLDKNLNFSKFEFILIGNFPEKFKNIEIIPPVNQEKLAEYLRTGDIFISPVKFESCSNSILEALACRVPVIALSSGGNADLVKIGGEMFENKNELLEKIDLVSKNLPKYSADIKIKNLEEISEEYLKTIKKSFSFSPKKINAFFLLKIKILLKIFNIYRKI